MRARLRSGDIGHEFAIAVVRAKCVQKTPNINLVAGEVAADGVSINGKAHERVPV